MIYVLLVLFVLFAALLLLPVGVVLDYSERGRRWFVVWLGLRIPVPGMARKVEELLRANEAKKSEKAEKRKSESQEEHGEFPKVGEIMHSMTSNVHMFQYGLGMVRSISRHIHVKVHRLDMVVATQNPALTGFAYGMTQAFGYAFAGNIPWHAEPDFVLEEPSLSFRVEVSATPIMVFAPMLRFAAKRRVARFGRRSKVRS